ncbi:MAG: hypothetical protein J5940_00860 [Clostridia bacterium]|nr:hypothetical protein [Clostridia bacterium]
MLLFTLTDLLDEHKAFLALPTLVLVLIVIKSRILEFFTKKELHCRIDRILEFSTRDKNVKGAGWGHGSNVTDAYKVVEITAHDKSGYTYVKAFRLDDSVKDFEEGDEIAVLRFINAPVLIKARLNNVKTMNNEK